MPSLYSANLKIELMTTGDKSGVWGSITNSNLGSTSSAASGLEQAIVGTAVCATADFTANVATYTLIDDPAYQVARAFVLNVTATLSAPGIINVPAIFKPYLVFNNSVGGFAVTVKVAGQTGVSIPNGRKAWLYNNGTDVGVAMDYMPTLALGTALPTTSGGTGQASYTAGDLPYYASGTALSKLSIGSNTFVLTSTGSAPQWVAPSTIPVGTATNLAGGTAGASPYQTAPGATTFLSLGSLGQVMTAGGSGPTYVNQNTLSVGTAANITGGAANRVVYQTGSNTTGFVPAPVTAGNALLWDGTNLVWGAGPAAISASNLAGGGAYTVVYQSSVGTTAYAANGTTGQAFIATTGAAPSWGVLGAAGGGTGITAPGALGNLLTSNGAGAWTSTAPAATGPSTAKTYYMAQF